MNLLAWNIQHGGGTRLARIVEEIAAYDPDLIAITEFRAKPGVTLCAALLERGWPHVETTSPTGSQNGIAVFSRTPLRRTRPCPAPPENLVRWLDIDLPEYGFGVGVLHVMAAGSATKHPTNVAKSRFWDAVLQAAETRLREPFLFVGDWNTGAHRLDETGKTFVCADHFGRLSTLGLDGHVAASQPWHYGVDLVFEVEGRHERQRIPARSCVRDPVAVVAHHVLPLLARATGVRGFGSLDGARGAS